MIENKKGVLLVVEDEPLKRTTLRIELTGAGYLVLDAPEASTALQILARQPVDVILSDLRLPGMNGLQFLDQVKTTYPATHVIMMTAYGSVDTAVDAIKRGAYEYMTKPFEMDTLLAKLERLRSLRPVNGNDVQVARLGALMGRSYATRRMFDQMRALAQTDQTVLVRGERGCCLDQVAREIHGLSPRAEKNLLVFNCVASNGHHLDQELFCETGWAKAAGGTVILNDVEGLSPGQQVQLLNVLDAGNSPFSHGHTDFADVRFACTTSNDLYRLVTDGRFNEDLYHRLGSITLHVPPLRDRRDDIPLLAEVFFKREVAKRPEGLRPDRFSTHAMDVMLGYQWPGNIAELERVVARATAFATDTVIQRQDILLPISDTPTLNEPPVIPSGNGNLTDTVAGVERTLIDNALQKSSGNQAKAAQMLGIPRTTLRDKMTKYGIVGAAMKRQPVL